MVSMTELASAIATHPDTEYACPMALNLYKTPDGKDLVTQAAANTPFWVKAVSPMPTAVQICLRTDDYMGWVSERAIAAARPMPHPYNPVAIDADTIQARIPQVIAFATAAMHHPNTYLWGGAIAPNYDCSGLVQAAFAAAGIQLPRDAYQQEAFVAAIDLDQLQPGDLIFFGTVERITHVALHLGQGTYLHSSGKRIGRNGIGLDSITDLRDPVSQVYHQQLRGAGRVVKAYVSTNVHL